MNSSESTEERIILAVAELQALTREGKKIAVSAISEKSGISRKTLYSEKYKHLLPSNNANTGLSLTNTAASQYARQIQDATNRALKAEKDLDALRANIDQERQAFISKAFSEPFLGRDVIQTKTENAVQELNNIRAQLNNKIQYVKTLELQVSMLESRNAEYARSAVELPDAAIDFHRFQPDVLGALKKFESEGMKGWLKSYLDECMKKCSDISSKGPQRYAGIIVVFHSFNTLENAEEFLRLKSGTYAVLHLALPDTQMRQLVLKPLKAHGYELHAITLISTSTLSKWTARVNKAAVPPEVVERIADTMIIPSLEDGFSTIFTKKIQGKELN